MGIYKAKKAIVIYVYYPLLTHNSQKGKIVIFIKILNEYKSTILFSSLISEGSSKMEKKKPHSRVNLLKFNFSSNCHEQEFTFIAMG